jgi:hypothetical protein
MEMIGDLSNFGEMVRAKIHGVSRRIGSSGASRL